MTLRLAIRPSAHVEGGRGLEPRLQHVCPAYVDLARAAEVSFEQESKLGSLLYLPLPLGYLGTESRGVDSNHHCNRAGA